MVTPTNELFPTQSREPMVTVVRTMVQAAVPVFVFLLAVVPEVVQAVMSAAGEAKVGLPGWAYAMLAGSATACTVIAGALARVMASPRVNQALDRFRLAAGRKDPLPARALDSNNDGKPDYL